MKAISALTVPTVGAASTGLSSLISGFCTLFLWWRAGGCEGPDARTIALPSLELLDGAEVVSAQPTISACQNVKKVTFYLLSKV